MIVLALAVVVALLVDALLDHDHRQRAVATWVRLNVKACPMCGGGCDHGRHDVTGYCAVRGFHWRAE